MTSDVQCLPSFSSVAAVASGLLTAPTTFCPAFPPRPPKGTRWGGRAKGMPNKVNQAIREAIQMAFEQVGAWST